MANNTPGPVFHKLQSDKLCLFGCLFVFLFVCLFVCVCACALPVLKGNSAPSCSSFQVFAFVVGHGKGGVGKPILRLFRLSCCVFCDLRMAGFSVVVGLFVYGVIK